MFFKKLTIGKNLFYNFFTSVFLLFSLSLFIACEKEENQDNDFPEIIAGEGVFIINEGNYNRGNASLGYIDLMNNKEYFEIFNKSNNRQLGDVFQSISLINDHLFLVINNSGKIEIINPNSVEVETTITGLGSPRKILDISQNKALVSDLYSNKIALIDLENYAVENYIDVSGWTEDIIKSGEKIFISNMDNNIVYSIDIETLMITDSIATFPVPNSMVEDINGNIWVLCSGSTGKSLPGGLIGFDPITNNTIKSIEFPGHFPPASKLNINAGGDSLYFISEDIWRISINDSNLPENPFYRANGRNFYGLGISPHDGKVFISDAVDFVQKGKAIIINNNGETIAEYNTGIIPGGFFFY